MNVAPSPQPDSAGDAAGSDTRGPSPAVLSSQFLVELNELLAAATEGRDSRTDVLRRVQDYFGADAIWLAPYDNLTRAFEVGVRLRA